MVNVNVQPFEIEVRTRHGDLVRADVYLPRDVTGPVPVLLGASPYQKMLRHLPVVPSAFPFIEYGPMQLYLDEGYAYVALLQESLTVATTSGQERAHSAALAATVRAKGVDGLLKDATRPPPSSVHKIWVAGRKPLTARKIKQVVHLTLNEKPPNATHWSERTMAARAGVAHGLKPHLTKTFKLSRDPNFVAKVQDIVGLYLNPPDKALVLAVDIQALDRTPNSQAGMMSAVLMRSCSSHRTGNGRCTPPTVSPRLCLHQSKWRRADE